MKRYLLVGLASTLLVIMSSAIQAEIILEDLSVEYGVPDGEGGEATVISEYETNTQYYADIRVQGEGIYASGAVGGGVYPNMVHGSAELSAQAGDPGSVGLQGVVRVQFRVTTPSNYSLFIVSEWGRNGTGDNPFTSTRSEVHLDGPSGLIAGVSIPSAGSGSDSGGFYPTYTGTLQPDTTYTLFVRGVVTASEGNSSANAIGFLDVTPIP